MPDVPMPTARLDEISALSDAAPVPSGEPNDDWFELGKAYGQRVRALRELVAEVRRARAAEAELHDLLDEKVGQALLDKTMFKGLNVVDGQVHLELDPARELVLMQCAALRGMLDGHGAENYVELDVEGATPSMSMDVRDGAHPEDSYTVTIQRRTRPTPHEFRVRAEKERDDATTKSKQLSEMYQSACDRADNLAERVRQLEAGAVERSALLEAARDALSAAGINQAHGGDTWPCIDDSIEELAKQRDEARALLAAKEA